MSAKPLGRAANRVGQLAAGDRLREVIHDAGPERINQIFEAAAGGHEDDAEILGLVAETPRQLEAVLRSQPRDVHERDVHA